MSGHLGVTGIGLVAQDVRPFWRHRIDLAPIAVIHEVLKKEVSKGKGFTRSAHDGDRTGVKGKFERFRNHR
jgi:hypothetical protein